MPRRQTRENFIATSSILYNNFYDYSKVVYKNNNTKVIIICPIHGEFKQRPRSHSNEQKGCYQCGKDATYYSTTEYIAAAKLIHGDLFDYSNTEYTHSWNKISIICKQHGLFNQDASAHLNGQGCKQCAIDALTHTTEQFIDRSRIIFGDIYDYSKTIYITAAKKVVIICKMHGEFKQTANSHLCGHGCAKCTSSISKLETKWLNGLFIPNEYRQTVLQINNRKYKTDAYDPITNTVYEFNGDFWHGNPKFFNPSDLNNKTKTTFGDLYKRTLEKENALKLAGYTVVSIWQSDFTGRVPNK